ncbi:MAG: hypothetical protein M1827_003798 [Pycnora praestabilis]|nr:MAG: hypothetical protein M1827_003798 [Pycnora praestabilis]
MDLENHNALAHQGRKRRSSTPSSAASCSNSETLSMDFSNRKRRRLSTMTAISQLSELESLLPPDAVDGDTPETNVTGKSRFPDITADLSQTMADTPKEATQGSDLPEFDALPTGHSKLSDWEKLSPTVTKNFRAIMGPENPGCIEFLAVKGEPTVCITCRTPKRMNRNLLHKLVDPFGFHISIGKGRIRLCGFWVGDTENDGGSENDDSGWPSSHGQYVQKPACGASIGVRNNASLEGASTSLGGYIKLLRPGQQRWQYYGLTNHHLIENDEEEGEEGDDTIADKETRYPDEIQQLDLGPLPATAGVLNGVLQTQNLDRKTFNLRSPSKSDFDDELCRLKQRSFFRSEFSDYKGLDNQDLQPVIAALGNSDVSFGRAMYSSGLCIAAEQELRMDWLLAGNIPPSRLGSNAIGCLLNYKEGFNFTLDQPCMATTPQHLSELQFRTLIYSCLKLQTSFGNRSNGLFSRIHGVGSHTGAGEGRLISSTVPMDFDGRGVSNEWSFRRRGKLGLNGDSGTWIFTENGKLLGMIWGYNDRTGTTYYTPIYAIFDHIKAVTGAIDLQVLDIQHMTLSSPPSSTNPPKVQIPPNAIPAGLDVHSMPVIKHSSSSTFPPKQRQASKDSGYGTGSSRRTSHDYTAEGAPAKSRQAISISQLLCGLVEEETAG